MNVFSTHIIRRVKVMCDYIYIFFNPRVRELERFVFLHTTASFMFVWTAWPSEPPLSQRFQSHLLILYNHTTLLHKPHSI